MGKCKIHTETCPRHEGQALISTAPAASNKLEVIQNQPLRLETGAVKSTPLASMQVFNMNNPSKTDTKNDINTRGKSDLPTYCNYWSQDKYHFGIPKPKMASRKKLYPYSKHIVHKHN
jgi:hypothetical protein